MNDIPAAHSAYLDGHAFVTEQLQQIAELLKGHKSMAESYYQNNWTFAGDMEFVSARLGEIINYLEGGE
jgi:hypothetical protein